MKSAHRILRHSIAQRLATSALTVAALASLAPHSARAVTAYTGASDNWANPAFWSGGVVPSGAFNQRINFNGGTTVTYGAAQGTTMLGANIAADSRAFLLGFTAGTGTLNITGGILQANATAGPTTASLVSANVNNATGVLNVSGGTLDLTTSDTTGGRVLAIGTFSTATAITLNGTVSVSGAGLLKVSEFRFNDVANTNGGATQITGVLNLDGGTMEVGSVREGPANVAQVRTTSTVNLNGGLLRITANNGGLLGSLDTVNVKSGGARIEVNAAVTGAAVSQALFDAGGGGGFIKTGTGNLSLNSAGNTYTGATAVNGGTLTLAAASTFATSAFNVNSTGTLVSNATGLTNIINVNNGGAANINGTSGAITINSGGIATFAGSTSALISVNTGGTLRGEGASTTGVVFGAGSTFAFDANTVGANEYFRTTGNINTTAGAGTKINLNLTAATISTGVVVFEGGSITTNGLSDFKLNTRGTLTLSATQLLFDFGAGSVVWKGSNGTSPTFWDLNTTGQNFTLGGVDDFFLGGDDVTFNDSASNFNPMVQSALAAGALTFDNSVTYTLSGAAVTATSLAKIGAGKVTIGNANTITLVTIDAGEVQVGDGATGTGSLGAANVTNNATLSYDFGAVDVVRGNNVSGAGTIVKNGAGKLTFNGAITATGTTTVNAGTLGFAPTSATNLDTTIGGAGGVEKSGTQMLTIDTANTYAGTTTIAAATVGSGGSIVLTGAGTLGSTAGGTTVASGASLGLRDGVTVPAGEAITISGTGVQVTNHFFSGAFNQRGAIQGVSGTGNVVAGPVSFTTTNTRIGVQDGASLELSGPITEATPGLALIFRGGSTTAGTILLSGAGNSWTGLTDIYGSTVKLGANNALPAASLLRVGIATVGVSRLDLNGFSTTVAGLATLSGLGSDAIITNDGAADSTLTLNPLANQTFPGTIQNGATNGISLAKTGSFTQTLTGVHTYTGATTISGGGLTLGPVATFATSSFDIGNTGTLTLDAASALTSNITIGAGGTLTGEGSTTGSVVFGGGSKIVFNPTTGGANEYFRAGSINTTAGAGSKIIVNLTAPVTSGAGIVVLEGTTLTTNGASDFKLNTRGTLSTTATQVLFDYAAGSVVWKGGNGTNPTFWDVNSTTQNFTLGGVDDVFFAGDSVLFNNTASNFAPTVQTALSADAITFDNTTAYTLTGAAITANSLTKSNTGKVTIANTNNIPSVAIVSGEVQLGNGAADVGGFGATTLVVNDATLTYDFGAVNATRSHSVSGTGAVIKHGSGTLTLTGDNSYFGPTTINAGTLNFAPPFSTTLNTAIGGAGNLEKSGTATLTINLPNTHTGLTTVTAGAIIAQHADAFGTTASGTVVASNGRIELSGGITVVGEPLTISGAGVNFLGALQGGSGDGTWGGNITLGSSDARLGAISGSTLTVTGAIGAGAGTNLTISGQFGSGVVVLNPTAANTYTGVTNIVRGTLRIGKTNALPTTTVLDVDFANAVTDAATFDLAGFSQEIAGLRDTATTSVNGLVSNSGGSPSILTINDTADFTYDGSISGDIIVTKKGAGAQTLGGTLTFPTLNQNEGRTNLNSVLANATITANGGRLDLNADANNSAVTVNAAAIAYATVSQTLATLTINDGGTFVLGNPAPPAPPEFGDDFGAASIQGVPEPGSAALLFGGMLTLLGARRRK